MNDLINDIKNDIKKYKDKKDYFIETKDYELAGYARDCERELEDILEVIVKTKEYKNKVYIKETKILR